MSRGKLPDIALLSQNAVFPAMVPQQALCFAVVLQLCLSSMLGSSSSQMSRDKLLTLRFCTKSMVNMMAQRCLLVQPYAIQILSNVPR